MTTTSRFASTIAALALAACGATRQPPSARSPAQQTAQGTVGEESAVGATGGTGMEDKTPAPPAPPPPQPADAERDEEEDPARDAPFDEPVPRDPGDR